MNLVKKLGHLKRLLSSYREYHAGATVLSNPPLHVYLEITSACNLRCRMCPVGNKRDTLRKPAFLSREAVAKVLAEAEGKVREFSLHVLGEPLLHPEIEGIIRDMHARNFRVRLYTNATLLGPEIAERLLAARLDYINFSVDGYTPETYAGIRVGGDFDKVMANIGHFLDLRRRQGTRLPYTVFQLIELEKTTPRTRPLRDAHLRRVRAMGFDWIRVIPPNSLAGESAHEFSNYRKSRGGYFQCNQPWSSMAILANGDYAACCLDTLPSWRLGNIATDKLMDVWNGEGMRALRAGLAAGKLDELAMCRQCSEPWQPNFHGIPLSKPYETARRLLSL